MSSCPPTKVPRSHPPATDPSRWRLNVKDGAQWWTYSDPSKGSAGDGKEERDQSVAEKYYLGIPFDSPTYKKPTTPREAAELAFEFLKRLQNDEGFWSCEYGGPLFLLPGLCISHYVTGFELAEPVRKEVVRYLKNFANVDGGWGLHIEHHSTMYGTVMNYVALRILGVEKEDPVARRAREWIQEKGGAILTPSWGKLLLACMNLYDYEGMHPIPPELWCLPSWSPFHPGNMWIHSRNVYTPMSYLYGVKFSCPTNAFVESLRQEIYREEYGKIDWGSARSGVHEADLYFPHSSIMEYLNIGLGVYEKAVKYFPYLRTMGLKEALNQVYLEDENTKFLDVGPVNQVLNLLCVYHAEGGDSDRFRKHVDRIPEFLFLGADGMMMNGTDGVQLWDTAFIVQAAIESGLADLPENKEALMKAHAFLDACQIKDNSLHFGKDYRHPSKGAWPFSKRDQSYTVSDCTAEGLKAVLYLQKLDFTKGLISDERLFNAVDILLSIQNPSGGAASYELIRGGSYYEYFNVSEVFADIMIEYSYVECTTAVLLGLTTFRKFYPDYRQDEIQLAQKKAVAFIKSIQWEDGSWYGSWGICFTYATFFALESLSTFGEFYHNSSSVKQACDFLVSKQQSDGGWGETYKSCEDKVYTQAPTSQVVNTSWAVLSLLAAKYPDQAIVARGIKLIADRQLPSGEWRQELIEGVFNKNCMISYPNYKLYFTMWALGRYAKVYQDSPLEG